MKRLIVIAILFAMVSAATAADRLSNMPVQIQAKTAAVGPKRPHLRVLGAKLFTDKQHHGNVGMLVAIKNIGSVPCIYATMHLTLFGKDGTPLNGTDVHVISMDRTPLRPGQIRGPLSFYWRETKEIVPVVTWARLEFVGYGGPYDPQCQKPNRR